MTQPALRHHGHSYRSRSSERERAKREAPDGGAAEGGAAEGGAPDGGAVADGTTTRQEKAERPDGKIELTEEDCWDKLGFAFPKWKKWGILSVIFAVQVSMNFNASLYANAVTKLGKHFGVSEQVARVGQMIFLVCYAFGSELWAPWSEEIGRWPIMQLSLGLVNIWQLPCAIAPNFATIIVCRGLGGLSSAGGSVTLGMVADMWEPDEQQYAVAYIVLSSVAGSALAPIVGGFVTKYLSWHWNFILQVLLGGFVQILHFFIPETRCSILVTREAKRRRKRGENVWSADELREKGIGIRDVLIIWARPFIMFVREPIVLCLSLLSGFSDALIFTFLASYKLVYEQWGFGPVDTGLAFVPIMIGYFMAYSSFLPWIHRHCRVRERDPDALKPEARLYWLLWTAPLEPIGLFGFAWTSLGPPNTHWIAPMIFSTLIAIANYAIYMATIDYMVASYGPYSASATGGNALARDLLAGIAAMYSIPMYKNIGRHRFHLEDASTILGCVAVLVIIPIYIFYWWGPKVREHSRFAQTIASERMSRGSHATTCGSGVSGPEEVYLGITRSRSASHCRSRSASQQCRSRERSGLSRDRSRVSGADEAV